MDRPILLFDSECTMCTRFKIALEKMDKNQEIDFHTVRDDDIFKKFPFLDKDKCLDKIHLIDIDLKVYVGGDIVQVLKDKLPYVNKISWLLETDVAKKLSNFFYDKVAEFRKSKGCSACSKK